MKGWGLKQAIRRTGLTRRQLRYLEQLSALGPVLLSGGRTVYTDEQLELLEHIARLRALGARIDEAAAIGRELLGRERSVSDERLEELMRVALERVERNARVAHDLGALRARRGALLAG